MQRARASRWVALAMGAVVMVGCSSSGSKDTSGSSSSTAAETAKYTVPDPAVTAPPAEGQGISVPQPSPPLPAGYTQEEYFIGGTATKFKATATPNDGFWKAAPEKTAPYKTRVVVRRPAADKFSGTVVVEWFNVSALESGPDWAYLSTEMTREGDAYIGVSTQVQGVEGGKTLLDVQVSPEEAGKVGSGGNTDKSGLKHIDPVRYGTLSQPGDAYAFDIFSQVGKAVKDSPSTLLGGLEPKHVIAVGESQSAAFLTSYVDAVHPLDPVFDGFLIHSRGAGAVPLNGDIDAERGIASDEGVLIRTDLNVPVFMFETETDLTLLGYSYARQADTKRIRTWEVAGTSHADAQLLRAAIGGPRSPSVGSLLGCPSINIGPQPEVLTAAYHQLVGWVAGGAAPATGEPLKLRNPATTKTSITRDDNGNALGGVRNPMVDVPIATLSGEPPPGTDEEDIVKKPNGICLLFGTTTPFDQAKLVELYGTADTYLAEFRAAATKALAAGFLLRPEADSLVGEAEANRALFG